MKTSVAKALNRMKAAQHGMVAAVEKAYPMGSQIVVWLDGRHQHRIIGEVIGYGSFWANPEYIRIENVTTGKRRNVHVKEIIEQLF